MVEIAYQPLVSVLIPVRNASAFVRDAINSVRDQTYTNWEVVVVDDGSTDNSAETVVRMGVDRVKVISLGKEYGITHALNVGLRNCNGEYIARLDADDVCFQSRIETQVNFLKSHPEVAICGSSMVAFRGNEEFIMEASSGNLRLKLLTSNQLFHPTVMFRSSIVPAKYLYATTAPHAEDYELWTRIAVSEEIFNISEPLLRYRIHEFQISVQKGHAQAIAAQKVRSRYAKALRFELKISMSRYFRTVVSSMIWQSVWRLRSLLSRIRSSIYLNDT